MYIEYCELAKSIKGVKSVQQHTPKKRPSNHVRAKASGTEFVVQKVMSATGLNELVFLLDTSIVESLESATLCCPQLSPNLHPVGRGGAGTRTGRVGRLWDRGSPFKLHGTVIGNTGDWRTMVMFIVIVFHQQTGNLKSIMIVIECRISQRVHKLTVEYSQKSSEIW
jgi:hypothetical protein